MRFLRRTSKPCGLMHRGTDATCFQDYFLPRATDTGQAARAQSYLAGVRRVRLLNVGLGLGIKS
jgi:hypothetical protein